MSSDKERPTLNFINQADQVEVQVAFGYQNGEPTAAMFHNDTLILIPREFLQIAVEQGWDLEEETPTTQ